MINHILETLTQSFQAILKTNLVGIYVHGSLCLGGFNFNTSDIDLLVVVKQPPTLLEKTAIIETILKHIKDYPKKGLEMSVVLLKDVKEPTFPIPFELHYSPYHHQNALNNPLIFAKQMHGTDEDLAVHFTITKAKGITLYGPNPQSLFAPIPKSIYLASIIQDLQDGQIAIYTNPSYHILNLCRTLAYLQDDMIISKDDGGKWAMTKPLPFSETIQKALLERQNKQVTYTKQELDDFYQSYMPLILLQVNKQHDSISYKNE